MDWGIQNHGGILRVNYPYILELSKPIIVDVETDEKGGFVGVGLTQDGKDIYYYTSLREDVKAVLETYRLVGHNLKFDAKQLINWGVNVKVSQLYNDTILMSYVINSTKDSHSLKDLGKERGYVWPTYKEIVGKGKLKKTLDKQEIDLVANYNAMDVFVTYKLYKEFKQKMDSYQTRVLEQIELPTMRILFEMELKGVLVDVDKLKILHETFTSKLLEYKSSLQRIAGRELNPNSNKQVAEILEKRGHTLPTTEKGNKKVDKNVLESIKDDEFAKVLIDHNKIEKLVSTYTGGMLERETLPRVYPTYNQISRTTDGMDKGIVTGRLSCSDPNLQQIPSRTEEGKLIRELFIPKENHILIDADYSQVEYRLLAHFTKEPLLIKSFLENKDVHEETGKALGVDRDTGKTLNFASIYGAGSKKIAKTARCSEEEAKKFIDKYWSVLPKVTSWINQVKYQARQKGGVYTLMKRWIPLPGIYSSEFREKYHWERCAVNFIIQGSAAEVMKLAMIELKKKVYSPLLTVHDELLFEVPVMKKDGTEYPFVLDIKSTMESIVKLDVPLIADVGVGVNWREAKE